MPLKRSPATSDVLPHIFPIKSGSGIAYKDTVEKNYYNYTILLNSLASFASYYYFPKNLFTKNEGGVLSKTSPLTNWC